MPDQDASEDAPHTDLSIIIVNWNVRDLLARCLGSIQEEAECIQGHLLSLASSPYTCEVIVVDNASSDGSVEMVRSAFPWARLVVNSDNLGFTRANNQGMAMATGRYLLLLNPDTEVRPGALHAMLQWMDRNPSVGGLGPLVRYPDGSVQPTRRRFPTLATAFLESTFLQQWFPRNAVARRYYLADRPDDVEQRVDWVVGACLLLRGEAVRQVGPLDEGFFMYSEELDYCYRLRAAGWEVAYLPAAEVVHHEGRSSEQVPVARQYHFDCSKVRFYRKHHGRLAGTLVRGFLLLGYGVQLAVEGAKWLVGHRRDLRAQRVRAYAWLLRSGLRAGLVPPQARRSS
ncbi:MAG: glycosyltransferase family 2 protein [Anaerolineae bacterium]|nr:glycosyltransferase family 2 protein [Anaerolineae bacterium]